MQLPQLSNVDYTVLFCYMLLLTVMGFIFKSFTKNANDFFVGGHKISWWMAGASAFMCNFSAFTFTGLAGVAYNHGTTALAISWVSMLLYLFAFFFSAARWRQTRCVTGIQILRNRYGPVSERFYGLLTVPSMFLGGAVWLYGLAIFITAVLGMNKGWSFLGISGIQLVIIIVGLIVCIYSTIGGNWAVQAIDFMQTVILMPITILLAIFTFLEVGGVTNFINQLPATHLNPINEDHSIPWLALWAVQSIVVMNAGAASQRFLSVRDGKNAKKAALFAASLFLIAPLIWYIPPMAASFLSPDIANITGFTKPEEASYAIMSLRLLPSGLCGLMVAAMFAATISSMDTALNSNAGIMVINLYKGWLNKKAGAKEMLLAGRLCNLLCGVGVISVAIFYSSLKDLGVFHIMVIFTSAVGLPRLLPDFLQLILRRTPWWSAILATSVCVFIGFIGQCSTVEQFQPIADLATRTVRNLGLPEFWAKQPWDFTVQVSTTLAFCLAILLVSSIFWKKQKESTKKRIIDFYKQMETPIDVDKEVEGFEDHRSLLRIGILVMIVGGAIFLLIFLPSHTLLERVFTALLSFVLNTLGFIMYRMGRKSAKHLALLTENKNI